MVFELVRVFVTSRKNDFFFEDGENDNGEKCNPKSSLRANLLLEFVVVVVILFLQQHDNLKQRDQFLTEI
jgi:hypothetical protein|tara:strand:+ start:362 stop:571 length:210 start_codon:yes stop_codon:yes gene_type:complete